MKNFIQSRVYYKSILNLAIPVIIANIGQTLVQIVDTIMVGQLGNLELASASFANMILTNLLMFGLGLSMGITPLVGHQFTVGKLSSCSKYFQNALLVNSLVGMLMIVIFLLFSNHLHVFGQSEAVNIMSRPYFVIVGFSALPFMVFLALKQFMDGLGNTKVSMYITIGANVLNIILNYILIFGKLGFPSLGIEGAAYATLISRVAMPVVYLLYLRRYKYYRHFVNMFHLAAFSFKTCKELVVMGLPIALQLIIEFFALSMTGIMIGWIGINELAANQIVFTTISMFYLVTDGISTAVTILVSHSFGKRNRSMIRSYALAGMQISSVFMCFAGMILFFFGSVIASIYVQDVQVALYAGNIFMVVAFMEVSDGLQATTLGVLRGMGDVTRPMIYAALCYGFISIGVAYIMGFVLGFGYQGVYVGFASGVTLTFILYSFRIKYKLKSI